MTTYSALPAWLRPFAPFLQWWPSVNRNTVRDDAMAGLTGALIVLPQGVAFATIAGLPPEYGLYAAMVPAIVAALFGSSWHLVSGPTTAISIALYAALSKLAEPGSDEFIRLALTLTFLVGLYQLVLGLARLGTLVNFISHTVVIFLASPCRGGCLSTRSSASSPCASGRSIPMSRRWPSSPWPLASWPGVICPGSPT